MALLNDWNEFVEQKQQEPQAEHFWKDYFELEKGIYERILGTVPDDSTVTEFSKIFDVDIMTMTGFLDGINDSLKVKNDLDTIEEDSVVTLNYNKEQLYKNMVKAKAEWLYGLSEWDAILTKEKQKELYKEEKLSQTVVKGEKIGRNDPCTCGSGKKYKKCCGRNSD